MLKDTIMKTRLLPGSLFRSVYNPCVITCTLLGCLQLLLLFDWLLMGQIVSFAGQCHI